MRAFATGIRCYRADKPDECRQPAVVELMDDVLRSERRFRRRGTNKQRE